MQPSSQSMPQESETSVDIVICVHNAVEHVRRCLESLVRCTDVRHSVILVDDGSDTACHDELTRYANSSLHYTLIRNEQSRGYTRAANQGLRQSRADVVVLLNSDAIVTRQWLDRLLECGSSDPRIGIVGPLSNAAAYQSIPKLFEENDVWSQNPFPDGWDLEDVAAVVSQIAPRVFPRVAFINGFCFAIKRPVIDAIGYFDEESFPEAYGEEDDYCLRAAAAGFTLAVADHAYVYHARAQSYSYERRRAALKRAGTAALLRKHGGKRMRAGLAQLYDEPTLAMIRRELSLYLETTSPPGR
jgi:GT2 family glycosyltransferase